MYAERHFVCLECCHHGIAILAGSTRVQARWTARAADPRGRSAVCKGCERNGTNGGRFKLQRRWVGAPLRSVGGAVTERAADGADGASTRAASCQQ